MTVVATMLLVIRIVLNVAQGQTIAQEWSPSNAFLKALFSR